ncbi:type II secretion system protein GspM [Serratia sp. FGI94]|uniref:type II secretion system protein GspM n=1 Tax=Serratia sp. FGI94 TaxID=671990 RepID=UPI00059DA041|nr:type II secretion system protein GspM [Serratia sp. FGI94]
MAGYFNHKRMIAAAAVYLLFLLGASLLLGYQNSRLKSAESNFNMLQRNISVLGKTRHSLALTMKSDVDIETLIRNTALSHGVTLQDVMFRDDDMDISLPETSFSSLIGWLAEMQRDFGIVVKNIQIKVTADGDRVKVDALCLDTLVRRHNDVG